MILINLLPAEYRQKRRTPLKFMLAVAASVAINTSLLAWWGWTAFGVAAEVKSELAVLQDTEEGLRAQVDYHNELEKESKQFERREARLGEDNTGLRFQTASGWGARRESRALTRDYDLVIVDTPPHADRDARNAMELAALVVVPVQPTPADLWATEATLALAEGERVPAVMVLNRVPPRARLTGEIETALGGLDAPMATARLGNRVAFAESLGAGSTVLEDGRTSTAATEVRALAEELARSAGA